VPCWDVGTSLLLEVNATAQTLTLPGTLEPGGAPRALLDTLLVGNGKGEVTLKCKLHACQPCELKGNPLLTLAVKMSKQDEASAGRAVLGARRTSRERGASKNDFFAIHSGLASSGQYIRIQRPKIKSKDHWEVVQWTTGPALQGKFDHDFMSVMHARKPRSMMI
jgi:hypothetical protein